MKRLVSVIIIFCSCNFLFGLDFQYDSWGIYNKELHLCNYSAMINFDDMEMNGVLSPNGWYPNYSESYIFGDFGYGEIYNNKKSKRYSFFLHTNYFTIEDEKVEFKMQQWGQNIIPYNVLKIDDNKFLLVGIDDEEGDSTIASTMKLLYLSLDESNVWAYELRNIEKLHEYVKDRWICNQQFIFSLDGEINKGDSSYQRRTDIESYIKTEKTIFEVTSNREIKWVDEKITFTDFLISDNFSCIEIKIDGIHYGIMPLTQDEMILYTSNFNPVGEKVYYKIYDFIRDKD